MLLLDVARVQNGLACSLRHHGRRAEGTRSISMPSKAVSTTSCTSQCEPSYSEGPKPSGSDHIACRARRKKGTLAYLLRALRQVSGTVHSAEVKIARYPRAGEERAPQYDTLTATQTQASTASTMPSGNEYFVGTGTGTLRGRNRRLQRFRDIFLMPGGGVVRSRTLPKVTPAGTRTVSQ